MVRTEYDNQYHPRPVNTELFGKYQEFYKEMQTEFIEVDREDLLPNLKTLVEYLLVFLGDGISRSNEGYKAYASFINQLQNLLVREKAPEGLVERLFDESLPYSEYHYPRRLATKKTKYYTSMEEFKNHFGID